MQYVYQYVVARCTLHFFTPSTMRLAPNPKPSSPTSRKLPRPALSCSWYGTYLQELLQYCSSTSSASLEIAQLPFLIKIGSIMPDDEVEPHQTTRCNRCFVGARYSMPGEGLLGAYHYGNSKHYFLTSFMMDYNAFRMLHLRNLMLSLRRESKHR